MFVMTFFLFLVYFKDIEQFEIRVVAEEEHKVVRLKIWGSEGFFALIENSNTCNFSWLFCVVLYLGTTKHSKESTDKMAT